MNPIRILQLVLALVLIGAGVAGVLSYRHLASKAATADARIETAEANARRAAENVRLLQSRLDTLSGETIRRDEFDAHLRAERAVVNRNLDTASREDPSAAGYLRQPIPQRVRDAYAVPRAASDTER